MAFGGGEKYAVGLSFVRLEEMVDEMRRLRDEVRAEEDADDKPADHPSEEYHGERLNPSHDDRLGVPSQPGVAFA